MVIKFMFIFKEQKSLILISKEIENTTDITVIKHG